ncbi:hypothetical protein FGO68_gene7583 [Halteria grandinella]|uniref:Uncharacterized protein n=1 Tax=Halteria grandinella TaxID=5974 RepID=A0A8J8NH56_HALGN|nr:hypothetical protein FGO68_gene7583 [Halteria grandinella]
MALNASSKQSDFSNAPTEPTPKPYSTGQNFRPKQYLRGSHTNQRNKIELNQQYQQISQKQSPANAITSFSNFNSHKPPQKATPLKALDHEEAYSQGDSNFEEYLDEEARDLVITEQIGKSPQSNTVKSNNTGTSNKDRQKSERAKMRNLYVSGAFSEVDNQSRVEGAASAEQMYSGFSRNGGKQTADGQSRPKTYTSELIQRRNVQYSDQAERARSTAQNSHATNSMQYQNSFQEGGDSKIFSRNPSKPGKVLSTISHRQKSPEIQQKSPRKITLEAQKRTLASFNRVTTLLKARKPSDKKRLASNQSFTYGSPPPLFLNKQNFTASSINLRDFIMSSSEKVRTAFQPSSAQYHIRREFDMSARQQQQSKQLGQYQENLRNLWEISRQRCIPLISKKQHLPGPGAYDSNNTFEAKGYSFSKDMRVFDKQAKEELKSGIQRKEDSYVKEYAQMQIQTSMLSRNGTSSFEGFSVQTDRSKESALIRGTAKYSFPQQTRTTSIRSYDYNHVKAWPKCFYSNV